MNALYFFLALPLLTWLAINLWVLDKIEPPLMAFGFSATSFSLVSGAFWLIYVFFVSSKILPKVDALAYPDRTDFFRMSDNLVFKILRMNSYVGALTSDRLQKRSHFATDLRTLPQELKLPLLVYLYWMILNFVSLIAGFIAFEYAG